MTDRIDRELRQSIPKDRNLLILELPQPTDPSVPEWESPSNKHHAVSVNNHGTVRIWGNARSYTPDEALDIAYAMIAAAQHTLNTNRDPNDQD